MIGAIAIGILVIFVLAPVAAAVYIGMMYIPLWIMGIDLRRALEEITISEALFFGLYCIGCGLVVAAVFGRFV